MKFKCLKSSLLKIVLSSVLVCSLVPVSAFAGTNSSSDSQNLKQDNNQSQTEQQIFLENDNSEGSSASRIEGTQQQDPDNQNPAATMGPSFALQAEKQAAQDQKAEESLLGPQEDNANSFRFSNGQLLTSAEGADTEDNGGLSAQSVEQNPLGNNVFNGFDAFSRGYCTGTGYSKGIDVSVWNGDIDWVKVKASGVDFAIIRCGYGSDYGSQDDSKWIQNVRGCINAGIPFGVYLYSYAKDTSMADSEANHVLRCLSEAGLSSGSLSYPIYYDMEDSSTLGCDLAGIASTFCNKIQSNGYKAGVYATTSWFENYLTSPVFNNWNKWIAQWNTGMGLTYSGAQNFASQNMIWQFSDYGIVNGINGRVDLNYSSYRVDGKPLSESKVVYRAHVQNIGWQNNVTEDAVAGTTGKSLRTEALVIEKGPAIGDVSGNIEYRTHVQDIGWQDWVSSPNEAGTTGQSKRIEALKIRLTGDLANSYDVYYRAHVSNIGWMGWAKNGDSAGTAGEALAVEAFEVVLVEKGGGAPGSTECPFIGTVGYGNLGLPLSQSLIVYNAHVQNIGWQGNMTEEATAGTTARAFRLEAMSIDKGPASSRISGSIEYCAHVQDVGWQDWVGANEVAGTTGQAKRLEAFKIRLTGDMDAIYDVCYRAHVSNIGWMDWVKNGEAAGTEGMALPVEAFEILLVNKGEAAPIAS